ncbi:MAG: zincin-like metallopeptidase domain-containing protein [Terricaulis sp.]
MSQHQEKLSTAARVSRAILEALANGVRPWAKPWRDGSGDGVAVMPRRANGEYYRGINVVALWATAQQRGFCSPTWFTFRQALALGGHVRKGEHGTLVVFYKSKPKADADDASDEGDGAAEARRAILRGYVVFNRNQIDGLPPTTNPVAQSPVQIVDDAYAGRFAKVGATVRIGGDRAYYSPATDSVQLPPLAAFTDYTQYYATYAHELGHWTRHPTRLDRDFGQKPFGDAGYALEELVAELSAAFVGAVIGLPGEHIEDHASYIGEWIDVLRDNPNAFLTAAAKAQLAADYLLHLMGEDRVSAARDDAPPCDSEKPPCIIPACA